MTTKIAAEVRAGDVVVLGPNTHRPVTLARRMPCGGVRLLFEGSEGGDHYFTAGQPLEVALPH